MLGKQCLAGAGGLISSYPTRAARDLVSTRGQPLGTALGSLCNESRRMRNGGDSASAFAAKLRACRAKRHLGPEAHEECERLSRVY